MKHYIKLDKPITFKQLKKSLIDSVQKIKKDHYKNYFIYAYNKDYYKDNKESKKSSKHQKTKIYKN